MPPARMEGNVERWIVLADRGKHRIRDIVHSIEMHGEMRELSAQAELEHQLRAAANRLRRQKRQRVVFSRRRQRAHDVCDKPSASVTSPLRGEVAPKAR